LVTLPFVLEGFSTAKISSFAPRCAELSETQYEPTVVRIDATANCFARDEWVADCLTGYKLFALARTMVAHQMRHLYPILFCRPS